MDAKDYINGKERMTSGCRIECKNCPLGKEKTRTTCSCKEFEFNHPTQSVKIVEQWLKENPFESYKDVLVERMPNVNIKKIIDKKHCIGTYFGNIQNMPDCCEKEDCELCWNRECIEPVQS